MTIQTFYLSSLLFAIAATGFAADAPKPYGAVPSKRQLKWHDMEFYGFLHFTVNTFTDRVRLRITKAPVCPAITEFGLFAEPMQVEISKITHDR
jgi:hypothetical protein